MAIMPGKSGVDMRRFLLISTFCALFATSCMLTDSEVDSIGTKGIANLNPFIARIDSEQSRTYAVECEDGGLQLLWHADDCILVCDASGVEQTYKLQSGADSTEATFVYDENNNSNSNEFAAGTTEFCAVSPASCFCGVRDNVFKATIPYLQHHNTIGNNDLYRHTMVGRSVDGGESFDFRLFASLARLDIRLEEEEILQSVQIDVANTYIAGIASFDRTTLSYVDDSARMTQIKLVYDNQVSTPNSEGYMQMLPVDWTKVDNNVYYTVTTNTSVYKFCKRPTKKFEAGYIYTLPLWVDAFEQVDSEAELADGNYCKLFSANSVKVAQVRATDSTITIGWTISSCNIDYVDQIVPNVNADYAVDITKNYKVALYRDAECKNLVTSVNNLNQNSDTTSSKKVMLNNMAPPRFAFAGLTPGTTYYAKVWNNTDSTESEVLQVATTPSVADKSKVVTNNAKAGDLILFENFSSIVYGGEMSSRGASISRTDRGSLTEIAPVTGEIVSGENNYLVCSSGNEIGLFNTLKGLLDDFGLQNWGWIGGKSGATGGSICARPGYLKVGTGSNRSFICTPRLTAIPTRKVATLRVEFAAAPYGEYDKSTINSDERCMSVRALTYPTFNADYSVVSYEDACEAQYLTINGIGIDHWENYSVTLTNVPYGSSVAIGGGLDATTTNRMLVDDIRITVLELADMEPLDTISGTITYDDGTPAAGVSVSDGFSVVKTDADGKYTLTPDFDTWYIYYSIPENCQVPINSYGQPCFFTKFNKNVHTYDFTLTKCAVENEFTLFCLADPQCRSSKQSGQTQYDGNRFKNESVPAIKAHTLTKSVPCYAVTLGDIVYSEGGRNCEAYMSTMRSYMAESKIGMPVFQTMGNHDYMYFNGNALTPDETSSTGYMKVQRSFENVFGPINYSWNRGNVHIVSMRNMIWTEGTTAWNAYSMGFTDQQVEWLRQDLAAVPKDKLVIFCVHIPFASYPNNRNVQNVLRLLKQFPNCHIMSGHTHYSRNEPTKSNGIYEHVHAAVSGQWWWSKINGDGCPNGYGVYDISGNTMTDWYYMGINEGMNDRDYQIRLYRGDLVCGGGNYIFRLQHGNDVILANVFNADSGWKIEVYEDNEFAGNMEFIKEKKYESYYLEVPTDSCQDWWAIGYHMGELNRTSSSYYVNNFHMYKHKLKNPEAKDIRVEATDRFGRKYTCSEIIDNSWSDIYSLIR